MTLPNVASDATSAYASAVAERHRAVAHAVAERALALGGATRITAVFGDPVEHSLSPAMHNAAYAALGLDRVYAAFHVRPPMLAAAVRALSALGILGVNLTVPHKERAVRMVALTHCHPDHQGAAKVADVLTVISAQHGNVPQNLVLDALNALANEEAIAYFVGEPEQTDKPETKVWFKIKELEEAPRKPFR